MTGAGPRALRWWVTPPCGPSALPCRVRPNPPALPHPAGGQASGRDAFPVPTHPRPSQLPSEQRCGAAVPVGKPTANSRGSCATCMCARPLACTRGTVSSSPGRPRHAVGPGYGRQRHTRWTGRGAGGRGCGAGWWSGDVATKAQARVRGRGGRSKQLDKQAAPPPPATVH